MERFLGIKLITRLFACTLAVTTFFSSFNLAASDCGYESCPQSKPGYVNIHLVAHTHDDVGWLKTVDQYYYGARNSIQQAGVQYILDSVIAELQKSPDRRFIYVESGFFWRWWKNQDSDTKAIVKNLVDSGQLEFIGGGWCMNDEATAHYNAIIDQMTLGLRYLNETFGKCALPKVAWQIDPFGHSREQASLFANMGFDALFFGRLDYQDKEFRKLNQNMETIWSSSPDNLGKSSWLFTGALFNGYNPPDGFCFDILCNDEPINDDPDLHDYNLDKRVDAFIRQANYWASPYKTSNVLMTMGSDFHYLAAHVWFKNMDKLIRHVNKRQSNGSMVNVFYSTPSCYLQEVHRENKTWSVKTDDYFPYASDPHAFWTGYFTSRPSLKYFIHKTNNFFQACQQLAAMTDVHGETISKVFKLAEPLAVAQHHDAVSGTAKQHVTNDYALRLQEGIQSCQNLVSTALSKIQQRSSDKLKKGADSPPNFLDENGMPSSSNEDDDPEPYVSFSDDSAGVFAFCPLLNISSCPASELNKNFILSVYNPLARPVKNSVLRLPVSSAAWRVEGPRGDEIIQLLPISTPTLRIPGRRSPAKYEIVFSAGDLPALSVTQFRLSSNQTRESLPKLSPIRQSWRSTAYSLPVVRSAHGRSHHSSHSPTASIQSPEDEQHFTIKNALGLSCDFDGATGLIKSISMGQDRIRLSQNFYFYEGMLGNNTDWDFRASGAYIFRPRGTTANPVAARAEYKVYKGAHVTEVRQVFNDWVSQIIRVYEGQPFVEFEWTVGPIPIDDWVGKEVITRYSSDLDTQGLFYTDSNGREMLKRKRNYRDTWPYQVFEPISGNYYPVNSRIRISDSIKPSSGEPKTLIVLNDRAQGGSSINDGEIELMVHRRLLMDDAFGVGEALNETAYGHGLVARGSHRLIFAGGNTELNPSIHRFKAQEMFMGTILSFRDSVPPKSDEKISVGTVYTPFSTLANVIPENCHLLTLSKLSLTDYLIRFEHIFEKGEDREASSTITIPLQSLQRVLGFESIRETTLGGNQWKDEAKRFEWRPEDAENKALNEQDDKEAINWSLHQSPDKLSSLSITLSPMQIRTFVFKVKEQKSSPALTKTRTETNKAKYWNES